jgi:hypothetical protein
METIPPRSNQVDASDEKIVFGSKQNFLIKVAQEIILLQF